MAKHMNITFQYHNMKEGKRVLEDLRVR